VLSHQATGKSGSVVLYWAARHAMNIYEKGQHADVTILPDAGCHMVKLLAFFWFLVCWVRLTYYARPQRPRYGLPCSVLHL